MSESIVIYSPQINPEDKMFRQWSLQPDSGNINEIPLLLSTLKVSPDTHPRVCDLCAGDGAVSTILVSNGWLPENITCIDFYKPADNLAQGSKWLYLDLRLLAQYIKLGTPIPPEIEALKGTFDFTILVRGMLRDQEQEAVCKYFTREGGFYANL
ncbi:MAG: hypothetical protein Fur003_2330 [Candidatus Dojkabacteria bacterium]